MKKITYPNSVKVLVALLIISGISYLWLPMFHLRLNPSMLKKSCSCINCEYEKWMATGLPDFNKPLTLERDRIYKCHREDIFLKYK